MKKYVLYLTTFFCVAANSLLAQNLTLVTDPALTDAKNESRYEGEEFQRQFTIMNTGATSFSGKVRFQDTHGNALSVNELAYSLPGTYPSLTITWLDSNGNPVTGTAITNPVNGGYYEMQINNLASNQMISFRETIEVIGCLAGGAGSTEVVLAVYNTATDSWAPVGGNFVTDLSTGNQINVLDREITTPLTQSGLQMTRNVDHFFVEPRPTCTYNGNGNTGLRHFSYTVFKETADASTLKDIILHLSVPESDMTVLSKSSIRIRKFENNVMVEELDLAEVEDPELYLERTAPSCLAAADHFERLVFHLGDIENNVHFSIEFDEYYCCMDSEVGGKFAYNWGMSFFFNQDCGVQKWDDNYTVPGSAHILGEAWHSKGGEWGGYYSQRPIAMFGPRTPNVQPEVGNFLYNNRMSVRDAYEWHGPEADEGFVYNVHEARFIVVLKYEQGLNYTAFDPETQSSLAGVWYEFEKVNNPSGPFMAYENMHFRSRDDAEKQWHPVNPDGILPGTMAYNFQLPAGYKTQKVFVFELSDFPGYNPQATKKELKVWLHSYVNSANIAFTLEAECPAEDKSAYTLDFYFVPDITCPSECVLPMNSETKEVQVNCPGCQYPGGAGDFCKIERQTLGLADADNNHLADDGSMADASVNADNDLDNDLRLDVGILGDTVKFNARYYLTAGGQVCVSGDGASLSAGPDDNTFGNMLYSYLDVLIPFGQNFEQIQQNGLDMLVKIYYNENGNARTAEYEIPAGNFSNLVTIADIGDKNARYFFDLSLPTLAAYLKTNSDPAPDRYRSSNRIELEFLLKVVENETSGDPVAEMEVQLNPYFSPSPQTLASLSSGAVADQLNCVSEAGHEHDGQYSNWLTNPDPNDGFNSSKAYLCEGFFGGFNLAGVHQESHFWTHTIGNSCEQGAGWTYISTSIGRNVTNLFRNEYRASPLLESIQIAVPDGWTHGGAAYGGGGTRVTTSINYLDAARTNQSKFVTYNLNQSVLDDPNTQLSPPYRVGNFTIYNLRIDYQPVNEMNINSFNISDDQLISGDEKTHFFYWLGFTADCQNITQEKTNMEPADLQDQNKMRYSGVGGLYTKTDNLTVWGNQLGRPSASIELRSSGTNIGKNINVSDRNYEQAFELVNIPSSKSVAQNAFIGILADANTNQYLDGLPQICDAAGIPFPETSPGSGIFILGDINIADFETFKIKSQTGHGSFVDCIESSSFNLQLVYGWDCDRLPQDLTPTTLATLCNYFEDQVKLNTDKSSWEAEPVITANPACDEMSYSLSVRALEGGIDNVKFRLTFETGVDLKTGSLELIYGTTSLTSADYTITQVTASPAVYLIELENASLTPPFRSGKYNLPHVTSLTIEFTGNVTACTFDNTNDGVEIEVEGTSFCNSALPVLRKQKRTSHQFTLCNPFEVEVTGENSICSGESTTIYGNVISGGRSGFNFEWYISTQPDPIGSHLYTNGSSSLTGVTPDVTTTYIARVTDEDGCVATDDHQVEVLTAGAATISGLAGEYCTNDPRPTLTADVPGGTFSGPGITDNGNGTARFSPWTAGAGEHTITYTLGSGCYTNATAATLVKQSPHVNITLPPGTDASLMCEDLLLTSNVLNGATITSYQWFRNGISIPGANNPTYLVPVDEPGTYRVLVTADNQCTGSASINVINDLLITCGGNICPGETPQVQASNLGGVIGNYTFQFLRNDVVLDGGLPSLEGEYRARVYIQGCTLTSAPCVVEFKPTPPPYTIAAFGNTNICPGEEVEMAITEPASPAGFVWNTGETISAITVNHGGTYEVTVTHPESGCRIKSNSVYVNVPVLGGEYSCVEGVSRICGFSNTPSGNYHWFGPDGNEITDPSLLLENGECLIVTEPGSYTITNDGILCSGYSASFNFTGSPSVTPVNLVSARDGSFDDLDVSCQEPRNFESDLGCNDQIPNNISGDGIIDFQDLPGHYMINNDTVRTPGAWNRGLWRGEAMSADNFMLVDGQTSNDDKRIWYMNVPVENGLRYKFKASVTNIDVNTPRILHEIPELKLRITRGSGQAFTYSEEVLFETDQPEWIDLTGIWHADLGSNPSEIVEIAIIMKGGGVVGRDLGIDDVYFIPFGPCDNLEAIATLSQRPCNAYASVDLTERFTCNGESVSFTVSDFAYNPDLSYIWYNYTSGSKGSVLDDDNDRILTVSPSSSAVYLLEVTDVENSCKAVKKVNVHVVDPFISIAVDELDVCQTLVHNFETNRFSGIGGVSYRWFLNGNQVEENIAGLLSQADLNRNDEVYCQLLSGCITDNPVLSNVIVMGGSIPVSAGPDQAICSGESVQLSASSAEAVSWNWAPATGLSATDVAEPFASPEVNTTYTVEATGISDCRGTEEITVTVLPADKPELYFNGVELELTLPQGAVAESYSWYRNDVLLSQVVGNSYTPEEEGLYRVDVDYYFVDHDKTCMNSSDEVPVVLTANGGATDSRLVVYPVPAYDNLNIIVKDQNRRFVKAALINVVGMEFETTLKGTNAFTVNITHLPDGVYLLRLTDEDNLTEFRKILLEK